MEEGAAGATGLGHDGAALHSALNRFSVGGISSTSGPSSSLVVSPSGAASTGLPGGGLAHGGDLAALMAEDTSFLQWAESSAGRAALAAELRMLRTQAAANLVTQVCGSMGVNCHTMTSHVPK